MKRPKLICAPGQSLYDVALEAYGSLDSIPIMVEDNPFIIPVASNTEGLKLYVRDQYTDKENVITIFSKRKPISS